MPNLCVESISGIIHMVPCLNLLVCNYKIVSLHMEESYKLVHSFIFCIKYKEYFHVTYHEKLSKFYIEKGILLTKSVITCCNTVPSDLSGLFSSNLCGYFCEKMSKLSMGCHNDRMCKHDNAGACL